MHIAALKGLALGAADKQFAAITDAIGLHADINNRISTFSGGMRRRLIFAQIRRATTEPDDVMDIFAHVCERLHENELARLQVFAFSTAPRASFATWLVAVVRNLIVDWFRARDGRSRAQPPKSLSPLARRVYELVFLEHRSFRAGDELAKELEVGLGGEGLACCSLRGRGAREIRTIRGSSFTRPAR